tara:strand:- start:226 stop:987 length:762 start_codon:yes stop_codon:yes gene_type:complete
MSIKIEKEPIYNQIKNTSGSFENITIKGIDELIAGSGNVVGFNQNSVYIEYNGVVGLQVASTSTADTTSGTGAQSVRITGLYCDTGDNLKYKERTCLFNMAGTSNATLASGTNSFSIINKVEMIGIGSGNCNAGDISVKKTGTSSLMGFIKATYSKSHAFIYGVNHAASLLIKDIHLSCFTQTACMLKIYSQNLNNGARKLETQILITEATNHINHQINLKVLSNHTIYADVIPLETITGNNYITMNASCIEI